MAITTTNRSGGDEMSMEEFKEWIKKFDGNGDGKISKDELRKAARSVRGWFSSWKSGRGIRMADSDGDGFIDDGELENLAEFARRNMGLKIALV